MNSFERVLSVLKNEQVDRKTFTAVLSQYGLNYCGASQLEYFQNADLYINAQKIIYSDFRPDIIFGPFALSLIGKSFGSELKFYPDKPPVLKKPAFQSVNELLKFPYPDIQTQQDLQYLRKCIRELAIYFKNEVPIAAIALNPVDLPILLYGFDKWLEYFLFDRTAFFNTIEYIIPFFIEFTNTLISDGALCAVFPTVFANSSIVTKEQTVDIVNPILKSAFSKINGGIVIHHGGVPFLPYLDTFTGFPDNMIGFGLDSTDNIIEARKIIGDTRLLFYGLDGPSMYLKKPDKIRSMCLEILELTQNDPKHIFYTNSSDILCQTPKENIQIIRETILDYYHLKRKE